MQKFNRGNLVKIANLANNSCMSHFQNDCEAIVIASYKEQFVYGDDTEYTLLIEGSEVSWYPENILTLISEGGEHLIKEAKQKREEKLKPFEDSNWVYDNWNSIKDNPPSAAIITLGELTGFTNWWGSRGEGLVLQGNLLDCWALMSKLIPATKGNKKEFFAILNDIKVSREKKK